MQALEKAFSLRKLLKGVFQQNKLVTQERRQYRMQCIWIQ